jgi:hypothetical protein
MKMTFQPRRQNSLARTSSYGNLPPRQNVAIQVESYVLKVKGKNNPDEDYVEGFLMHDVPVWGMKATAEVGENGEPGALTTRVKVMLPKPKNDQVRTIFALSRPKGAGVAIDAGGVFIIEKAYYDKKDGFIKGQFTHGCANAAQLQEQKRHIFSDMLVSVRPEGTKRDPKDSNLTIPSGRVDVLIADPQGAVLIPSREALVDEVSRLVGQSAMGNPGFQLLLRALPPAGLSEAELKAFGANSEHRVGGYVALQNKLVKSEDGTPDAWVPETALQLIERFEARNPGLTDAIGEEGWQVEFVPMMAINQAKSLIPSKAEAGKSARDNSTKYGVFGEVTGRVEDAVGVVQDNDGRSLGMIDCGWISSHVVVERVVDEETGREIWFTTYQNTLNAMANASLIHDVKTPLTPEVHLAAIEAEAIQHGANKQAYYQAKKPEATEEAAPAAPGR